MNLEVARNTLLTHSRSDKNGIFPDTITYEAKITNPICGDHVELKVHSDGVMILDIGHKARACAICSASASLLCEEVKGKTIDHALTLSTLFEKSILESSSLPWPEDLSGLSSFEHIRVNPARKVCALLPWTTLRKALK